MAKFMGSLGQLLGSVGGATFSHNRGGSYVKRRGTPTNPNSIAQTEIRGILSDLSAAWGALSTSDRAAWNLWADSNPQTDSLGNTVAWTGHQAYIGLNSRLKLAGATVNSTPPITGAPAAPASITPTLTEPGEVSIAYTATPMPAGTRMLVWWTKLGGPGQDPNFNQARLLLISTSADASPVDGFATETMQTDQECNIFAQFMDATGQVSPVLKARATVAAI